MSRREPKIPGYEPGEFDLPKNPDFERNMRLAERARMLERTRPKTQVRVLPSGAVAAALAEPALCRKCQSMHHFVVNRDGQTLCVNCDPGEP